MPTTHYKTYFTEYTAAKGAFYMILVLYVIGTSIAVVLQPFLPLPCNIPYEEKEYGNPDYNQDPCRRKRFAMIFFLTIEECDWGRRLVAAVALGGIIGWERRQADRPAGIRTMSLVSLGACLFTICSAFAFQDGPMEWDASRISAAIPSGVGFLGAGLIFKQAEKDENGETINVVHGLTTSAAVWMAAAIGIACGGELYFSATYGVAIMALMLRFGPRILEDDQNEDESNDDDDDFEDEPSELTPLQAVERAEAGEFVSTNMFGEEKRTTPRKSAIRTSVKLNEISPQKRRSNSRPMLTD